MPENFAPIINIYRIERRNIARIIFLCFFKQKNITPSTVRSKNITVLPKVLTKGNRELIIYTKVEEGKKIPVKNTFK